MKIQGDASVIIARLIFFEHHVFICRNMLLFM